MSQRVLSKATHVLLDKMPNCCGICEWLWAFLGTASDGGDCWCSIRQRPGAQKWVAGMKSAIAEARKEMKP